MDRKAGLIDTHHMRGNGILPILAGLVLFGIPAWADPPARVGRISYLEGAVAFASDSSENWASASLNYPVTTGDRISTAEGGRAEVHVGSTAIRVAPDSGISFTLLDDQAVQVRLDRGSVSVRLRHIEADEQFEIDTQTSSITLSEPVEVRVDQTANGDASVRALIGSAEVATGQSSFTVYAGQTAGIPAADPGAYWVNSTPSSDDWDRWVASRDAAEDHVASARYVSREMDGVEDLDAYGTWEVLPTYGPCWIPRIPSGVWSPYRFGRWAWVGPWGWTWIDVEPWGFAPFHYGRWALASGIWAWVPGAIIPHPVYAPALVTWGGGRPGPGMPPDGAHISWEPLRPHELYHPLYQASIAQIHAINGMPFRPSPRGPVLVNRRPGTPFVAQPNGVAVPTTRPGYRPRVPGEPSLAVPVPQNVRRGPLAPPRYVPVPAEVRRSPEPQPPRYVPVPADVRRGPGPARGPDGDPTLWPRDRRDR